MHKIWHDLAWEDYLYWQNQDSKNRIVFRIMDDRIEILQCGSHYRDK